MTATTTDQKPPHSNRKMARFLDLALETRLEIYRHLPKEKRPNLEPKAAPKPTRWIFRPVDDLQLALLSVSRQIRSEAIIVLYEENRWQFNVDISSIYDDPSPVLSAYELIPEKPWFPHLRHIQIMYHLNCPEMKLSAQFSACQPLVSQIFEILGKAPRVKSLEIVWNDVYLPSGTVFRARDGFAAWKALLVPLAEFSRTATFSIRTLENLWGQTTIE